jgi:hypothetical protein
MNKKLIVWISLSIFFAISVGYFIFNKFSDAIWLDSKVVYSQHYQGFGALKIENAGAETISFIIGPEAMSLGRDGIKYMIKGLKDDFPGETLARKAWRFVIQYADYYPNFTTERCPPDPLLMLNSSGFPVWGGNNAEVLAEIWKILGYKSRVWNLGGHRVPEVMIDGQWAMYDPKYRVYYINDKYRVLAVEDLEKEPHWITNPVEPISLLPVLNIPDAYLHIFRYSGNMADFYKSSADNYTHDWYPNYRKVKSLKLSVPPAGAVEFPLTINDNLHHKDDQSPEGKNLQRHFLKLTVPKGWTGSISIPLILFSVNGEGRVKVNNDWLVIPVNGLSAMTYNIRHPAEIFFKDAGAEIALYYLINMDWILGENGGRFSLSTSAMNDLHITNTCDDFVFQDKHMYIRTDSATNYDILLFYEKYRVALDSIFSIYKGKLKNIEDISPLLTNIDEFYRLNHNSDGINLDELNHVLKYKYYYLDGRKRNIMLNKLSDPQFIYFAMFLIRNNIFDYYEY